MESHVRTLGILHIIFGALGVMGALALFMVFGGLATFVGMAGDHDAGLGATALGGIGFVIGIFVLVISLPGLIGGIGLLKLAPWSRMLMIVISAIELLHIPFGTALGIYGLWALTKPETAALFATGQAGGLPYSTAR
jgi:hypothetical protein